MASTAFAMEKKTVISLSNRSSANLEGERRRIREKTEGSRYHQTKMTTQGRQGGHGDRLGGS